MEKTDAKVPKEFFEISFAGVCWEILRSFLLWLVPPAAVLLLYRAGIHPALFYPVATVGLVLSAFGLHRLGLVGHDGNHFSLHNNPRISAYLGVLVSSFVPFHMDLGFAVFHADHHRFTNTEKDPDHVFFGQYQNWFSRLFLARLGTSNRYLLATLKLAFNRWPADQKIFIGLKMPQLVRLARFNVVVSGLLLALYGTLTYFYPLIMLAMLWIPTLLLVLISGLRPYVEHAGTGTDKNYSSRSWMGPVFDWLFIGVNYHLAHHLYPSVPSYKLGRLHRWLKENGRIGDDIHVAANWKDWMRASAQKM